MRIGTLPYRTLDNSAHDSQPKVERNKDHLAKLALCVIRLHRTVTIIGCVLGPSETPDLSRPGAYVLIFALGERV
jgi:hypothetical protein